MPNKYDVSARVLCVAMALANCDITEWQVEPKVNHRPSNGTLSQVDTHEHKTSRG